VINSLAKFWHFLVLIFGVVNAEPGPLLTFLLVVEEGWEGIMGVREN